MAWGLLAGAGLTSLAGGYFGRRDARSAQRRQERQVQLGVDEMRRGLGVARGYLDEQLGVARGIEESVLGSLDAAFASQVRNIMDQERRARAELESDLSGSGLDTTTLGPGLRNQVRAGTSRALTDLGARFAVERGDQIMRTRQPVLGALGDRASLEYGAGQNIGSFLGNVQYQAPNTAASIGALGGSLTGAYLQGQQLDILRDALRAPLPAAG